MATSTDFEIIALGVLPKIDTAEGNDTAENAAAILGMHGTASDPLFDHVQSLTLLALKPERLIRGALDRLHH